MVVALALFACQEPQVPTPAANASEAPPGVDQKLYASQDAAGQACMVLGWLDCPEAKPEGTSCVESVRLLVEIGTFERKNLLCIRTSRTVDRVRTCDVECAP